MTYITYGTSSSKVSYGHEKLQMCGIFCKAFTHVTIQAQLNYAGRQSDVVHFTDNMEEDGDGDYQHNAILHSVTEVFMSSY
jgi:hypothetical protein